MTTPVKVEITGDATGAVAAFHKTQEGLRKISSEARRAQDVLGDLGTLFAAKQMAGFVKGALDSADQLFKMAQKTGVAVEQLSTFSYIAQQAEVSQEGLADGFKKLSKSLDSLNSGEASAVEAFGRIGLSAKDLKGLSLDKAMLKVAEAQSKFADGAGKAAVSLAIFGKSGTDMIPLLNDLANGGFDNAKNKLTELGLVISGDMAKASQDFNDSMTRMEMAAKGATVQIAQGMLPGLTSAADGLTSALAGLPAGAKAFGASFMAVGTVATAAAVAVRSLGTALVGLGPAGIALVAVSALAAGLFALKAAEAAAHAEAVKANEQQRDRVKDGAALVEVYKKESLYLEKSGLSVQDRKEHEEQLKKVKEDLIKLNPDFLETLIKEKSGYKGAREELEKKLEADRKDLELKKKKLAADIASADAELRKIEAEDKTRKAAEGQAGMAAMQNRAYGVGGGQGFEAYKARLQAELAARQALLKALSEPEGTAEAPKKKVQDTTNAGAAKAAADKAKRLADEAAKAAAADAALFAKQQQADEDQAKKIFDIRIARKTQHKLAELQIEQDFNENLRQQGLISEEDLIRRTMDLEARKLEIEKAGLQRRLAEANLEPVERARINSQIQAAQDQHNQAMNALAMRLEAEQQRSNGKAGFVMGIKQYLEESKNVFQQWKTMAVNVLGGVENAFASGIKGMMTGSMKLGEGLKTIWKGIADTVIGALAQMAAKWIVATIAQEIFRKKQKATGLAAAEAAEVTAAAGYFVAYSWMPFVGTALALANIGIMEATMAAMKVKAVGAAEGGWFNTPTLTMIGEGRRPELVVPDTSFKDFALGLSQSILAQERQAQDYRMQAARYVSQAPNGSTPSSPGAMFPNAVIFTSNSAEMQNFLADSRKGYDQRMG